MFTRLVVICVFLVTSGCGLFGMAIGAAVPHYSDDIPPKVGREVRVETEVGDTVTGELAASDPAGIVVLSHGTRFEVERWHIKNIAARARSEWKTGLHVGIAIDVACTVIGFLALIIGAAAWHPTLNGF